MSAEERRESAWRRALAPIRQSLQARLVASVLAVGTLTTLLTGYVVYNNAREALGAQLEDQLDAVASRGVVDVRRWLGGQRSMLEVAAGLDQVVDAATRLSATRLSATRLSATRRSSAPAGADGVPRARLEAFFRQMQAGPVNAEEIQLLSAVGGRVVATTDPRSLGSYAVSALYFTAGRDSAVMQPIYPSPTTGRPRLTIATPVRDASHRLVGVLAAHLDLQQVEALLRRPNSGRTPFDVFLVNKYREFVSAERFGRAGFRRGVQSVAIERARAGGNGVGRYVTFDGATVIGAWRWLPDVELALLTEIRTSVAYAPAQRLLAVVVLTSILAVALLSFGVRAVTRRVTRPVLATARAAARVAAGDFSTRAQVSSEDEVGHLARSFNRMTEQLDSLYRGMRGQVDATRDALRQVHESQALLQAIVDNASTLICVTGTTGRILLANQRFLELFEIDGDGVGRSLHEMLDHHGATVLRMILEESRARGALIEREFTLETRDEAHVWQAACFPLRGADGTIYAVGLIGTDLTERARAEEERRLTDARVQQARKLESLGVMAGGIAHDFNNILGAILANADLARDTDGTPEDVRESLEEIVTASRRAADLTRQMLAYAGRASFEKATFDLRGIIRDMAGLVRASHSKRIELGLELGDEPAWILGDSAQLSQVVLNLLTNAMEAIGDDVGRVCVTCAPTLASPPLAGGGGAAAATGWCHVSVRDTGAGMDAETQRRIFEPFFTTKRSGRGLGLSAVVGIVRSSGGVLDVRSVPGEGTCFDLFLPRGLPPSRDVVAERSDDEGERDGVVLLVDDEESLRAVARRTLERAGLRVLEAATGEEAVALHGRHAGTIDLIVLDLTMPGMSGVDALREIRAADPDVAVIVASGYDARDSVEHLRAPGVHFLPKPYGVQQLLQLARAATRFQRA